MGLKIKALINDKMIGNNILSGFSSMLLLF